MSTITLQFVIAEIIKTNPVKDYVAAISCGIVNGQVLIDLDYDEDSSAEVDANFVMTERSGFSEVQVSGEENTFDFESVSNMVKVIKKVMKNIFEIQKNAIGS